NACPVGAITSHRALTAKGAARSVRGRPRTLNGRAFHLGGKGLPLRGRAPVRRRKAVSLGGRAFSGCRKAVSLGGRAFSGRPKAVSLGGRAFIRRRKAVSFGGRAFSGRPKAVSLGGSLPPPSLDGSAPFAPPRPISLLPSTVSRQGASLATRAAGARDEGRVACGMITGAFAAAVTSRIRSATCAGSSNMGT